jgi:diguanylate cyclase (GGDEF)-like protein
MRALAILGLVGSLLLGAIAAAITNSSVSSARNTQDRSLQQAVSSETGLISAGERQTVTALSLVLVNPAVRELLSGGSLSPAVRKRDLADSSLTLTAIQRSAFLPLSAVCLDDGAGRQLACTRTSHPAVFPARLSQEFVRLARSGGVGTASGAFLSPVNGQFSVAFLAPFRLDGRLHGFVHLDISIADTHGSSLIVNNTPGVNIVFASYANGRLALNGPTSQFTEAAVHSSGPLEVGQLGLRTQSTMQAGHRAMVSRLPLEIGAAGQKVALLATALPSDPSFMNEWSPGMISVLVLAFLTLIGSSMGLFLSNRRVTRELSTDALTGLRNRRALMEDLPRVCHRASEDQPAFLWFFDLNGFKRYNDSFGHVAGDTLLARLGDRLRTAVKSHGVVYRLGGDEFCVIIAEPIRDPHALFQRAREALAERGGAFAVTASAGAVEIPRETTEPTQALRLADQHMYREKAASRGGAADLITAVLHAALAQRHPDLGAHSNVVADDVETLARTIGLDDESIKLIVKAGELHDVGKLGIPDEIITKPGPLSEQEWEFMKQHTVIGEQIIAAAGPSLERIGPLVRASHERWDGMGYPDGLVGNKIPLGSRIITICDSFSAMLDKRPYKRAIPIDQALAELRRCAGTQFDPHLVDVFCRVVGERMTSDGIRSPA